MSDVPVQKTKEQIILDRSELPRLIRRGYSFQMISEQLNIPVQRVESEWKIVVQELRVARDEETKALVALKLEELAEVKKEAWAMWEKSKQDFHKLTTEKSTDGQDTCPACNGSGRSPRGNPCMFCQGTGQARRRKRVTRSREGQCGNPHYLKIVLTCIQEEAKLAALYPLKGYAMQGMSTVNWDMLSKGIPDGPLPNDLEEELRKCVEDPAYRPGLPAPEPLDTTVTVTETTVQRLP